MLASMAPGGLVPDTPHLVRASVGIAVSAPEDSSASLLARADAAMYRSKTSRACSAEALIGACSQRLLRCPSEV